MAGAGALAGALALPIMSPLAAAGEAEELWMSGYVSLRQRKLLHGVWLCSTSPFECSVISWY